MSKKTDDFEQYENEVWKPVAERNILSGNSRHWILAQVKDRADNSFEGFTHFVWNLKGNPEVEFEGNSGFKWDKLWEGLESSRDMQDSEEYTLNLYQLTKKYNNEKNTFTIYINIYNNYFCSIHYFKCS